MFRDQFKRSETFKIRGRSKLYINQVLGALIQWNFIVAAKDSQTASLVTAKLQLMPFSYAMTHQGNESIQARYELTLHQLRVYKSFYVDRSLGAKKF